MKFAQMPDATANRLDNPLRKLRTILGDAEGPLQQEVFAALVGVPVATLRAIERGSRSMTANSLRKIYRQTGAIWNKDSETWTSDRTRRPFTWNTYQQYRTKLSEMPDPEWYLEQFRSHIGTIHELFKDCPAQQWKVLSLAIGDALAGVRKTISPADSESPKKVGPYRDVVVTKTDQPLIKNDESSERKSRILK